MFYVVASGSERIIFGKFLTYLQLHQLLHQKINQACCLDPKVHACMADRKVKSILFVVTICLSVGPTVLIALTYARIFWFFHEIKKRHDKLKCSAHEHVKETLQFSKCLFASFLLYTVCW